MTGGTFTGRAATAVLIIGAAGVAACGADGSTRIERSDPIERSEPAPDAPTVTSEPDPVDDQAPTSTSDSTTTTTSTELREPELGVGDELFPSLGSADLDVLSYVVDLDASDPVGELVGSVEITARVTPGLAAIAIDADGPTVESVSLDGSEATFELTDGELVVEAPAAGLDDGEVVIEIDYRVTPEEGRVSAVGLPVGWITAGDGAFVLNEPDGASTWLPSNDHPSDKASWRFEIDAAAGHVVSANGELLSRPADGEAGTWVWQQVDTMPTYLVHLVVGDYELVDGGSVASISGRDVPLTHLVPAGETERFDTAMSRVADRIAFFEERFGPYPLERYGLAFVEGLSGLAMETQGRSLFGADDLADDGDAGLRELLLSHELAHQWFGNAVSPAEWDDLWLNESLTTYAQWLWQEEVGQGAVDERAARMLARRVERSVDATGEPDLANLFGFERYDGGAVVVHALRSTLGDDAFFELMQRWIAENAETSRSTDDFIALAETVADRDLDEFFDDWLFARVPPESFPS